ncbi:endonuclease 4-like isoform X1 [Cucumis melo var. makuwa]|uniref:Aspergillus nuclease S1 n=1 Tax=Cucumis melo var. makuwa TaxID=1194695 RepID=A0A5D3E4R3_CUCMM|nr:endonuclease 4-like isoform X1 [Cucumis melo var. makuwa]
MRNKAGLNLETSFKASDQAADMGQSELCWTANVFVFLLLLPGILGWGREGHYAVCKIAEGYLTEDALSMVRELLPASAEGDLAAVCSWADELRENHDYHWSSVLHFVDTPDFFCNYNCSRDCHDSHRHKGRCVTAAIYNYTMQLESAYKEITSEVRYNLTEALMFLSHFIGDVHQPLHVGFVGDLGGNLIKVGWYQRSTNLHHVWDTMIIESALKRFYHSNLMLMIQAIQSNISDEWHNEVSAWRNCTGNHTACPNPIRKLDGACDRNELALFMSPRLQAAKYNMLLRLETAIFFRLEGEDE